MKEGKFTQFPNNFIDMLMSSALNKSEVKVLMLVARKTWGWNKEWDRISLTQFEKGVNLSRPCLTRTLRRLVKVGLLVKKKGFGRTPNAYKVDISDQKASLVKLRLLVKYDTKRLVKVGLHTKYKYTKYIREERKKDKIKKEPLIKKRKIPLSQEEYEAALLKEVSKPGGRDKIFAILSAASAQQDAKERGRR